MRRATSALTASAVAALIAAWPSMALASERALPRPDDTWLVAGVTVLGLLGVLVVAAIGYLYRRERGLEWEFQRPDEPPQDDHD